MMVAMKLVAVASIMALANVLSGAVRAGEVRDRMNALSAAERTAALGATVRGVDYSCAQPLRSRYQGTGAGRMIYIVRCEKGYTYAVSIRDDDRGETKVLDCEMARALGIDCSLK